MKHIILISFLCSILIGCQSSKSGFQESQNSLEIGIEDNDSTEYELIVFDARFETYLITQPHPQWYYSDDYYKQWNNRYCIEWNIRHSNPLQFGDFYETQIPYDTFTDYGVEFNYRLYQYFQFIEKEYNIILINRRGTT